MRRLALVLLVLSTPAFAQLRGVEPPPGLGAALPAGTPLAGCAECDVIYAGDCAQGLWAIDVDTGVSTFLGTMPTNMFDIGMSADGRLFGIPGFGGAYELSTCDASATTLPSGPGGNGLGGDLGSNDQFGQGPPLVRWETAGFTSSVVGGTFGGPPPAWCGFSSGDLAMSPIDGLLYSSLGGCPSCPGGDALVTIDPATGDAVTEVGCIRDAGGAPFSGVFGLAFDSLGRLWGGRGNIAPSLLEIDPATGIASPLAITGGYSCSFGLASVPCPRLGPARCEPLTQGFWKRVCAGPHPSGEHERLADYLRCVAAERTFASVASVADACDRLHPNPPNSKCEQAEAQFMALTLNVCSGRLGRDCCIAVDGETVTTVGEAMDLIDALLSSPTRTFRDCQRAQAIADAINTAAALCPSAASFLAPSRRHAEAFGAPDVRPGRRDAGPTR